MRSQLPKLHPTFEAELTEARGTFLKENPSLSDNLTRSIEQKPSTDLLPQHKAQLASINPAAVTARGYRSITDPCQVKGLGFNASQLRVPGLLIPLHFASQEILLDNKVCRFQYRPDAPREKDGKPVKYETPYGSKLHLDVPPCVLDKLQDITTPLIVTEGTKKADAAASHGLCCISVLGVWNFDVDDWKYIPLNRREVYICYDSDVTTNPKVAQALRRFRSLLRAKNATVKTLYLPAGEAGGKVGLDDFFASGGTVESLLTLTRRNLGPMEPGDLDATLPTIETQNRQIRETVDETISAMVDGNDPPVVFISGGNLTRLRVIETELGEIARLETLGTNALSDHLSRIANFVSISFRGKRSVNPPVAVVQHLLAHGDWPGIPPVYGIVGSPVFAPNGKLCDVPGYSEASKLYYHSQHPLELHDTSPTPENISRAKSVIFDDLFIDFPFADKASRAHALAMLLLPFVRSLIPGPTPLHLFDAPKAGTGKTLLANLIANVFSPAGTSVRVAPTNEDEWRKQLTTFFRDGGSHLMFDNVRELDSAVLQAALTAPDQLWTDRLLGSNTEGRYPMRCVWAVTCNNIMGTREQLRRCVWIRLDAKTEHPETRSAFHHADIIGWLRGNRSAVVSASITLIRAWIDSGQPKYVGGRCMGSFDAWVRVMGGILETVGEFDFLGNQTQLSEVADTEGSVLGAFANQWWAKYQSHSVQAGQLVPIARQFYEDSLGNGSDKSQGIRLGKLLSKYRDWVVTVGSLQVVIKVTENRKLGQSYKLQENVMP